MLSKEDRTQIITQALEAEYSLPAEDVTMQAFKECKINIFLRFSEMEQLVKEVQKARRQI